MNLDEIELIEAVKDGDRSAYASLVRSHRARILKLCEILLSNPTEADDAAQDVFVKAFESISKFRADSSFSTWITRIAHNHCMDLLRKRSHRKTDSMDEKLTESLIEAEKPDHGWVQELLASLKVDVRQILVLREVSHLSYEEIAAELNCTVEAVRARLRRAREEIQEKARHFLGSKNV